MVYARYGPGKFGFANGAAKSRIKRGLGKNRDPMAFYIAAGIHPRVAEAMLASASIFVILNLYIIYFVKLLNLIKHFLDFRIIHLGLNNPIIHHLIFPFIEFNIIKLVKVIFPDL